MAFYYYEYELSVKREERNGEGENDVGIGIRMQNVWRHCVSTSLSEPDGDLIVTFCDHPMGSSTGTNLAVDVSRMSASTHYASLARTYLVELLLNLGVTPPSFVTVLVDKIIRLAASATRGPELPVVEVYVRAVEHEDEVGRAVRESMEVAASPATAEAIERSLEKVRFEVGSSTEQCVVCLEEFGAGEEVTCMPCSHVYHKECIVKWLQTSHMCPLCRFELPKAD